MHGSYYRLTTRSGAFCESECIVARLVISAIHRSTTAACLFCGMKSCTGSTSLGALQVGSTGIPFATWDRSTVPDKPPHVGVGGHWTSVPAICCSTETDRSTVPLEDVWLSGVFGCKSVSLECITGQSDFRHFQASFEDLLLHVILDVSHVQRIRDFSVMRYINVRFTYLLTIWVMWHEWSASCLSREAGLWMCQTAVCCYVCCADISTFCFTGNIVQVFLHHVKFCWLINKC